MDKIYACIDLKSFYASVEAVERGLDPFKTNLVVSDETRGNGAITLAITPALKKLGIRNRCRLFEIPPNVEYIIARPRMKLYMKYSADIYGIYLNFVAPEDIHIYSIDECFLDLTPYLSLYKKTPMEIVKMIINKIYEEKGIVATAGVGTNLFLAKIALDISAKHSKENVGFLNKERFRKYILKHRPITDIWGIGTGIANRLEKYGIYDLNGIRLADERLIYKLFGINAEILIDHANGEEPCTIKEIHEYKPENKGVSNSQILFEDYNYVDAWIVIKEMIELLTLEITEMDFKTQNIGLSIGYSKDLHKPTGGTRVLSIPTNSFFELRDHFEKLYFQTVKREVPIRKLSISLNKLTKNNNLQLDLFGISKISENDIKIQKAMINIKKKYGKNSILRASSLFEKATAKDRNKLVGGHFGGEQESY